METTEIVLEPGLVGEEEVNGFQLFAGSAAAVVHAFPNTKLKSLRLTATGPEKIVPQRLMTAAEVARWLAQLEKDGYTLKLTNAQGQVAKLADVSFVADPGA